MSGYESSSAGPLFDLAASEHAKTVGVAVAADGKKSLLEYARRVAETLPAAREGITADDVVAQLVAEGVDMHALGNSAGALFAGKRWQWTGERRKSRREQAHANELKVWRLVE